VGCCFVGSLREEVMEVGAGFLVFLADSRELGGDDVKLCGDGHDARDGSAEDRGDGAFTSTDCLESVGGEVLAQFGVHLEAIPGFCEDFCQEDEGGVMVVPRGRGTEVAQGDWC